MLPVVLVIIGLPFVAAGLAVVLPRRIGSLVALTAAATVLGCGLALWSGVRDDQVTVFSRPWFPSLGIAAGLRVDRFGVFFVLLIGFIGLGIFQYSRAYFRAGPSRPFLAAMLAFMGSMCGIVLSDSLLLLFIFWELTTILSALLIGIDHDREDARQGALLAFLVTGAGGLALLAGIILLGLAAGTDSLSELTSSVPTILASPLHLPALFLILIGAFTKSAQFPFHFWLPAAMAAPAPISSYLHSATLVKGGIFLIARMEPIFGTSPFWQPTLATVGLATFLLAGWSAVRSYDLKELLAYSTAAYLGMLVTFYAYAPVAGRSGEMVLILTHALYKSALFLLVGWLEKAAGTRCLSLLEREQWFRTNPFEAVLFGIGAGAMAGVPLLLGFLAKEVFTRALFGDTFPALTPAIAVGIVASVLSVAYSLKLFVSTFWGPSAPDQARSASPGTISSWLLVVPACLLVPLLVGGFVPATVAGLLEPETPWEGGLAIWHQADAKVAVSVGIFASGILLFWVWRRVERIPNAPLPLLLSEWAAERLLAVSGWLGHALQAGGHPRYLGIILIAAIVAMGGGGVLVGGSSAWQFGWGDELDDALVPTLAIIGGAILTVALRSRVAKLVMMAVTGYGLALIFALYRAPDLALTQILAETISLVFLLLIFRSLPTLARDSRPAGQKLAHGTIAMATGLAMAALAWGAGVCTPADRAGAGHLVQSLPAAKGRNVVNVILVDFRGADTLGEIVVLAIAAIGILALLRQLPPAKQTEEPACGR